MRVLKGILILAVILSFLFLPMILSEVYTHRENITFTVDNIEELCIIGEDVLVNITQWNGRCVLFKAQAVYSIVEPCIISYLKNSSFIIKISHKPLCYLFPFITINKINLTVYIPNGLNLSYIIKINNGVININIYNFNKVCMNMTNGVINANLCMGNEIFICDNNGVINVIPEDVGVLNISTNNGKVELCSPSPITYGKYFISANNVVVKIQLNPESSLTVSTSVTNGVINVSNLQFKNEIYSENYFYGTLGEGYASLKVYLTNGEISIT